MSLIDTHCHLTFEELSSQLDGVLARCEEAGLSHVVTIGTDLEDAAAAMEISAAHRSLVSCGVGFHPHEADKVNEGKIDAMAKLWEDERVVAMGEMGLDYHYDFADRVKQREVFAGQLARAGDIDKPVVIHCREALDDCLPILVEHGFAQRRVVFHCFTGTAEEATRIAEQGWRISFTGVVTFKRSTELQEIAKAYPADQLMVETDAPYLAPVPNRGKHPNEPSWVAHTARFLAELRGESFEAFADRTTQNAREFFGLT